MRKEFCGNVWLLGGNGLSTVDLHSNYYSVLTRAAPGVPGHVPRIIASPSLNGALLGPTCCSHALASN